MVCEDYNPEGCRAPPNSLEGSPMKDNFGYTSDDPMDNLPIWEPYAENAGYESQPENEYLLNDPDKGSPFLPELQKPYVKDSKSLEHRLNEAARIAGQQFINFALPEVNAIKEDDSSVPAEIWDTLGQPSGKYDFLVKYTAPGSSRINIEDIQPTGWEDSPQEEYADEGVADNFSHNQTAGEESIIDPALSENSIVIRNKSKRKVPKLVIRRRVRQHWVAVEKLDIVHVPK